MSVLVARRCDFLRHLCALGNRYSMGIRSNFIEKSVVVRIAALQGIDGNFELGNFTIDY